MLRSLPYWFILLAAFWSMVLGGLWHGAAWNFLFWGFYQGLLLSVNKLFNDFKINKVKTILRKQLVFI